MSTTDEIRDLPEKYKKHKNSLVSLFKKYSITNIPTLIDKYRFNKEFKKEWIEVWAYIAKEDGGKLSLTTVGIIIGASLGGVGIAMMGGAVGLPLALVLGLGGFLTGSKLDSLKLFTSQKRVLLSLNPDLHKKLERESADLGISISKLIESILEVHYTKS